VQKPEFRTRSGGVIMGEKSEMKRGATSFDRCFLLFAHDCSIFLKSRLTSKKALAICSITSGSLVFGCMLAKATIPPNAISRNSTLHTHSSKSPCHFLTAVLKYGEHVQEQPLKLASQGFFSQFRVFEHSNML
jgi:hypothetical protein